MESRQPRNMTQRIASKKSVTLTIDGKSVTVPEGTTVLQACEQAQSPVPFYCYHPGLSTAGNCRICLVEIEGRGKLEPSCATAVAITEAAMFTTLLPIKMVISILSGWAFSR